MQGLVEIAGEGRRRTKSFGIPRTRDQQGAETSRENVMDITKQLAEFAANLTFADLPREVTERAKRLILDLTGIMIRARHDAESTPSLIAAVERLGLADGKCSVPGDARAYAPTAAALINGTLAHSLDFDDTHAEASLHSSAPIVPAALAAAELGGASGKDLIAAVVAGYEVQIRLSLALNPSDHYDRGFHPTATCGVFGAAAAAGKLLGMDAAGIRNAFGLALSQAAGSMEFLTDGAWTKRSHVGQAAQNGLICAVLAAEGFKGPKQAFEGRAGFLNAYAPNADASRAVASLGQTWQTMRLAVKPYPSCRYSHAAIDGLVALMKKHGLKADEVKEIEIGLPETGWKIIGGPDDKTNPQSVVDGQFSMPFCAAVALREGGLAWDDYKKHLNDETTRALTRKVTTVVDARAEAEFPANMAGVAKIRTASGDYECLVTVPKGEPDNFLDDEEFRFKFDGLCEPYLGAERAGKLANALLSLEQANSIRAMMFLAQVAA
jgi:2-methylcitrate dehydratase PrpD